MRQTDCANYLRKLAFLCTGDVARGGQPPRIRFFRQRGPGPVFYATPALSPVPSGSVGALVPVLLVLDVDVGIALVVDADVDVGEVDVRREVDALGVDFDSRAARVDSVAHAILDDDSAVVLAEPHSGAVGVDAPGHSILLDDARALREGDRGRRPGGIAAVRSPCRIGGLVAGGVAAAVAAG